MTIKPIYGFLIFVLCAQQICGALNEMIPVTQIDSIIKASTVRVYENPDQSIELGISVYENAEYSKKTRTKALMLVSLAYTSKRDYQKALEYVVKADEFSKELNDKILQIEILFRTGILYQQLKIFDKSIDYLEKTEQMALIYPIRDSVGKFLANSYTVKGFIYKDNLNCDIALEFFDKGIKEYQKINNEQVNTNLSIVYYNKGNCYTLLSDYENAEKSFYKSISYAKIEKANSLIAFAQKGLADAYSRQDKHEQAITLLQSALELSSQVGDLLLNEGIYIGLFENHLALNQWEDYQTYYDLYSKTQLDLKISERNSISDALDKNQELKIEEKTSIQSRFKNSLKWIISAVLVILISVIFIERKNKKRILELQNSVKTIQNQKPSKS